jgi:hypothetical protein
MGAAPQISSAVNQEAPGCRSSITLHLNPISLYNPRRACAQGTFVWGIVYPILVAFVIYVAVMASAFVIAGQLDQEPSQLVDRAAFGGAVSSLLTAARVLLSPLVILRRTKDLGWTWAIAAIWLGFALLTLWPRIPAVPAVGGIVQFLIVLVLAVVPGNMARARRAS